MRTLLSINNYFYRRDGSEAVYQDHNALFSAAGWQVVPFSMQHPRNPPSEWSRYFVDEIEFGHDYNFIQRLARVPKVVYSFEARRRLRALLGAVRPTLAHCHSIYHHLSPSILGVLRTAEIPTVMTLHDLKIACASYHMFDDGKICEACKGGRVHQVLLRRCVKGSSVLSAILLAESVVHELLRSYRRCVDVFVSPCQFYIDKLCEWGWPRERFVHIPNFVSADAFLPQCVPGKDVLYFGRFSAEKGLLTLVRAAARAGVTLRLVGDGPQRAELEAEARATGARVQFEGRLEGGALHDSVRRARVTVLPAEWYENGPMTVIESYALGKPVIGADIGGIPELIRPGRSGWLFPSGSVDGLAAALRLAMDTPDERLVAMGHVALELARTRYSPAAYQARMTTVYETLMRRAA